MRIVAQTMNQTMLQNPYTQLYSNIFVAFPVAFVRLEIQIIPSVKEVVGHVFTFFLQPRGFPISQRHPKHEIRNPRLRLLLLRDVRPNIPQPRRLPGASWCAIKIFAAVAGLNLLDGGCSNFDHCEFCGVPTVRRVPRAFLRRRQEKTFHMPPFFPRIFNRPSPSPRIFFFGVWVGLSYNDFIRKHMYEG